jgi:hypothetical protein
VELLAPLVRRRRRVRTECRVNHPFQARVALSTGINLVVEISCGLVAVCVYLLHLFYVYNKKMSESEGLEINGGELQDFTIDQLAGALALSLGAVGTLLLVIWQSRCACRCRVGCSDKCYLFDCSREPPPLSDAAEPEPEPEEDNP